MFTDDDPCCCDQSLAGSDPHQMQRTGFTWSCVHCGGTWSIFSPPTGPYVLAGAA